MNPAGWNYKKRKLSEAWNRIRPLIVTESVSQPRGVALLMVLIMVSLMAAFSTEFSYNTRVNLRMASNLEREVQAYYHARSSVELARMVIRGQALVDQMLGLVAQFAPNVASQNIEMWNYACKFAEIYNTGRVDLFGIELFDLSGQKGIGVEKGAFECVADAEDGRVNINFVETPQAKKGLFKQLFGYLQGPRPDGIGLTEDDKERAEMILNIIDWVDADQVRSDFDAQGNIVDGGGGSEDFAYAKFDYESKNAKFDSVDEVRLIDGLDDETFCKIRDKITVYSTEKLNVNTADIELIKAVVCEAISPELQMVLCGPAIGGAPISGIDVIGGAIEMCRNIKKMLYTAPFNSPKSFTDFFGRLPDEFGGAIPINSQALQQVIGTKSRVIRVKGTGKVGATEKTVTAVIDTSTGKYVYWRED